MLRMPWPRFEIVLELWDDPSRSNDGSLRLWDVTVVLTLESVDTYPANARTAIARALHVTLVSDGDACNRIIAPVSPLSPPCFSTEPYIAADQGSTEIQAGVYYDIICGRGYGDPEWCSPLSAPLPITAGEEVRKKIQ